MITEIMRDILNNIKDSKGVTWYAVRTFNGHELDIASYLKKKNLVSYIPLTSIEEGVEGKRVSVPALRNLVFLQKTVSEDEMKKIIAGCEYQMDILKNADESFYEISDEEMNLFRSFSNSKSAQYVSKEELEAAKGKKVRVVAGPLKGVIGELISLNDEYFVIKILISLGVMVHISRSDCEIIE